MTLVKEGTMTKAEGTYEGRTHAEWKALADYEQSLCGDKPSLVAHYLYSNASKAARGVDQGWHRVEAAPSAWDALHAND
jgi:hypothetical protein